MKPTYTIVENHHGGKVINALYEDGRMLSIPMIEGNADYQAYLNKDKPQVEHLTSPLTDQPTGDVVQ